MDQLKKDHPAAPKMLSQPRVLGLLWTYAHTGVLDEPDLVSALQAITDSADAAQALASAVRLEAWQSVREDRQVHFDLLRLQAEMEGANREDHAALLDRVEDTLAAVEARLPVAALAEDAPDDQRGFLCWLIDAFEYVKTAGMGTTQHLQLPLAEIFVSPRGIREPAPGMKWATREEQQLAVLAERVRGGELSAEEYEAQLDRLGVEQPAPPSPTPVSVPRVLAEADLTLVLGDPGTGKTTLLRYLALQHAQALLGGSPAATEEFGHAFLPLYVRAGDFARSSERQRGLGAFIPSFLSDTMECPVDREHLQRLITTNLRAGRCVVLIDGLDEVSSAAERIGVVEAIAHFVIAQQPRGNRFVCTSRISGYAAAPLPPAFAAVRLLEMDDASIEHFLRLYVPAMERTEAAAKSPEILERDAKRTIRGLVAAFANNPGVRRLAANPLLLTALLLVHRTQGGLPERRVDAYKAVADALGRTWRANQGIPETELPDERRLTQWLTALAEWMHAHRPEGSATLRDLIGILGPRWSKLNGNGGTTVSSPRPTPPAPT
ncbi:MAG: NACHT domain-containing protein [Solirubrobacteraceae bacterium]